jgi:hypothetical protein
MTPPGFVTSSALKNVEQGAAREQMVPLPVLDTQVWLLPASADPVVSDDASASDKPTSKVLILIMTKPFDG